MDKELIKKLAVLFAVILILAGAFQVPTIKANVIDATSVFAQIMSGTVMLDEDTDDNEDDGDDEEGDDDEEGGDEEDGEDDEDEVHWECDGNGDCIQVDGAGEDECSSHDDCGEGSEGGGEPVDPDDREEHWECVDGTCESVDGGGQDQCYKDEDCGSGGDDDPDDEPDESPGNDDGGQDGDNDGGDDGGQAPDEDGYYYCNICEGSSSSTGESSYHCVPSKFTYECEDVCSSDDECAEKIGGHDGSGGDEEDPGDDDGTEDFAYKRCFRLGSNANRWVCHGTNSDIGTPCETDDDCGDNRSTSSVGVVNATVNFFGQVYTSVANAFVSLWTGFMSLFSG